MLLQTHLRCEGPPDTTTVAEQGPPLDASDPRPELVPPASRGAAGARAANSRALVVLETPHGEHLSLMSIASAA